MKKFGIVKDKSFYASILAIMLPVAAQQAINMGVNMMDTMMLGKFGEVQLSASSLANAFYQIYQIFCMGITAGCSILMSQFWGARMVKEAKQSFALAMRLTFLFGFVFSAVTLAFPAGIMQLFTRDEAVIAAGVGYLQITAFIYIIHGIGLVSAQLMRSVGQPRIGLYVSIISFAVNVFANWIFIFGHLGAPRMEIRGAALGTLIARTTELIVTYFFIFGKDKSIRIRMQDIIRNPSKEIIYKYFKVGLPALCSDALLGFGRTATTMVIGRMGTAAVAANSMVLVVDRLFGVVTQGIANAAGIVIGHTIGAGDKHKAQMQGETLFIMSLGVSVLSGILFYAFGPLTLGIYNVSAETALLTNKLMITYAIMCVFQFTGVVMTKGVLRGGGDTKFLMIADIIFMWILCIPAGYISGVVFGLPIYLTIVFLRMDDIIKSVWCVSRLKSGKWIHDVASKSE